MADISKVTLPSGNTYNIKDETARSGIESLKNSTSGGVHYLGVTTTALADGSTTTPITIDKQDVTPKAGDLAIYGELEFIWSDTESKWHEFGSTGSLKALAFKSDVSSSYTPAGTVSQPTFTGGDLSINASYTPSGSVTIGTATTGTANYTPTGKVAAPTVTVTPNTTTVYSIESVGSLPTCTQPKFNATVSGETLTLGWTDGSFSAGSLPTKGTGQTVATGIKSATASAPAFTGDGAVLTATFAGNAGKATQTVKPTGTVSTPTFKGTNATITSK